MSGSDSEAPTVSQEETWECFICEKGALDPNYLENQALIRETTILFDIDQNEWLVCSGCDRHFHFVCIDNIPPNATQDDIDAEDCLCGWFMMSR